MAEKLWITAAETPYGNEYGSVAVIAETKEGAIAKARPKIEASLALEAYVPSQRHYQSLLDGLDDIREAEDGVFVDGDPPPVLIRSTSETLARPHSPAWSVRPSRQSLARRRGAPPRL
jgi:hypothetical protein